MKIGERTVVVRKVNNRPKGLRIAGLSHEERMLLKERVEEALGERTRPVDEPVRITVTKHFLELVPVNQHPIPPSRLDELLGDLDECVTELLYIVVK